MLELGDRVRAQNLPFSQKHFYQPDLEHWFVTKEGIYRGEVQHQGNIVGYLLENIDSGALEIFFPMPHLSGECILQKVD